MHEVDRSLVGADVALDRRALGRSLQFASAVDASEQDSETPVSECLNDGVVDVEDHGGYNNVTDGSEPGRVEIWQGTSCEPESDWLL